MTTHLPRARSLEIDPAEPPRLFVVVDTEEEFDWGAPQSRASVGVSAMAHIGRAQGIFDRYGVQPTYVVDYPVVAQPEGYEPLQEIAQRDRCVIGAHVHPWVNPPYTEELSRRNSFICNLSVDLQRAKLQELTALIGERFGHAPLIFKAGRYGIAGSTIGVLEELHYEIDASICPRMDFSTEGGPSFAGYDSSPFFLTDAMLELPCTVEYVGWAGVLGPALHRVASSGPFGALHGVGILARLGATNKIMLSPEGSTFEDMCYLTDRLVTRGQRALTLSFHSPSVEPGHTPYVRTESDLDSFLGTIDSFLDYFFGKLGGRAATPLQFKRELAPSFGLAQ